MVQIVVPSDATTQRRPQAPPTHAQYVARAAAPALPSPSRIPAAANLAAANPAAANPAAAKPAAGNHAAGNPAARLLLADWFTFQDTLTRDERMCIVDQALLLLEQTYVHLPFKRAMHAVDPIQRLKLMRHHLKRVEMDPEMFFHLELTEIFASLRDLHTVYELPQPFKGTLAWLPFLVEEYWEEGEARYLFSRFTEMPGPDAPEVGDRVLYWNGAPIARAIADHARRQPGGNQAARHAQALNSLTLRSFAFFQIPVEEWVMIRYATRDGEVREWKQPWYVAELAGNPLAEVDADGTGEPSAQAALAYDPVTLSIQEMKKQLYAARAVEDEAEILEHIAAMEGPAVDVARTQVSKHALGRALTSADLAFMEKRSPPDALETTLPTYFLAKAVDTKAGRFGYVRIYSFNIFSPDLFVGEFVRLLAELPETGLILDVRSNGGGHIHAAERLLQMLTPRAIEPQPTQFINSEVNARLCAANAPSTILPGLDLSPWIGSIHQSVETGAIHSDSFPITPAALCNDIGQKYYGPVLLIVDGLCYSATDIFAAGFQDHEIGPIVGVGENTGAGGANVWSHAFLHQLTSPGGDTSVAGSPFRALPRGAGMRVSIRRTLRVGKQAGKILEDLGLTSLDRYLPSRDDLLHHNRDMLEMAGQMLAERSSHRVRRVEGWSRQKRSLRATFAVGNVTRLDTMFNGRPWKSQNVQGAACTVSAPLGVVFGKGATQAKVEVRGYLGDKLVASLRETIER